MPYIAEIRAIDWNMTMQIHKKYYISKTYEIDDMHTLLKSHEHSSSQALEKKDDYKYNTKNRFVYTESLYLDIFREFQSRKEFWPWLQKVAQRPKVILFVYCFFSIESLQFNYIT